MVKNILVYITADQTRVLSGDPLTLFIGEPNERREFASELGRTLKTDVVQLKNGDYILIS